MYTNNNCSNLLQIGGRMSKYDKVMSFRMSRDIIEKLDFLVKYEQERPRDYNEPLVKINRTLVVEKAINRYYLEIIGNDTDKDMADRINEITDNTINNKIYNFERKLDYLLFLSIKNDLGNKLLYRSPGIIPPPPNIEDCIEIIVDERSGWNDALDEFLNEEWKKQKLWQGRRIKL